MAGEQDQRLKRHVLSRRGQVINGGIQGHCCASVQSNGAVPYRRLTDDLCQTLRRGTVMPATLRPESQRDSPENVIAPEVVHRAIGGYRQISWRTADLRR